MLNERPTKLANGDQVPPLYILWIAFRNNTISETVW